MDEAPHVSMPTNVEGAPGASPPPSMIRRRAARGAVALLGRGTALRVVGLAANLVLTRLLSPFQFGQLAIGLTVMAFSTLFVTGSLGSALVRRREPPDRSELEAVAGLQLLLGFVLAAIIAGAALPLGKVGLVTTIMVLALPVTAIRTSAVVVTERHLQYGPIIAAELSEALAYAALAIGAAALGFGVVGVACAILARAVIGSAAMLILIPDGRVRPRLDVSRVRPILGFGAKFQAVAMIDIGREQGLNVGVAAAAGFSILGLWSLAERFLQIPTLLFEGLWRISFPAVSRLLDAGEDVRGPLLRTGAALTILVALVLVPLAGGARDAIPFAFGHRWSGAAAIVTLSCLGMVFSGPISVVSAGYLYAVGNAGAVLNAMAVAALVVIGGSVVLVAVTGQPWGVGVGMLAGTLVEAAWFLNAARKHGLGALLRGVGMPALAAMVGIGCGWALSYRFAIGGIAALLCIAASEAAFLAALFVVDRAGLRSCVQMTRRLASEHLR